MLTVNRHFSCEQTVQELQPGTSRRPTRHHLDGDGGPARTSPTRQRRCVIQKRDIQQERWRGDVAKERLPFDPVTGKGRIKESGRRRDLLCFDRSARLLFFQRFHGRENNMYDATYLLYESPLCARQTSKRIPASD